MGNTKDKGSKGKGKAVLSDFGTEVAHVTGKKAKLPTAQPSSSLPLLPHELFPSPPTCFFF